MDSYQDPKSSHKTRNIIVTVVLVLLIGGAAAYFINKNQDEEAAKKAAAALAAGNNQPSTTKSVAFAPASTEGVPFVATINTTSGDKQVKGVMTSDGEGNVSYAYQAGGKEVTLTYTKDAYYLCSDGSQCLKYPVSQTSTSGFDPSTYQYDSSRIGELKNSANYKGQEECPAPATGTCDVWSVSNANTTLTMYVNTSTKRIARVTSSSGTTSSDITYEYKNAKVTIPTNATTAPTQ